MKRNCSTCICKEGSCYPSTTIFDKDKTCKSYDPDYEGYIADLEKENAELKSGCGMCYRKDKEQLTKAKEIIKMLHSDCYSIAECEDTSLGLWEDDLAKAEQFISEVEK